MYVPVRYRMVFISSYLSLILLPSPFLDFWIAHINIQKEKMKIRRAESKSKKNKVVCVCPIHPLPTYSYVDADVNLPPLDACRERSTFQNAGLQHEVATAGSDS